MRKALTAGGRVPVVAAGALILTAAALLIVLSGVLAGDGDDSPRAATNTTATTEIRRQDLVEVETEQGTLGYGDSRGVVNRLPGTVTWLPAEGSVVRPDRALFAVDGESVILLDGSVPAYRDLSSAAGSGSDVAQLERNLRELGYDKGHDMHLDAEWDSGTTAAVARWQEAHGLEQTGVIELGTVVFQPGKRRVASLDTTLGADATGGGASAQDTTGEVPGESGASDAAPASSTLMTTTSTRPVATIDLDTSKVELAKRGSAVGVELPSGNEVRGRITGVGSVATADQAEQGSEQTASTEATVEVTISLQAAESVLDQAPVSVDLERSRRKDVLAVPVTALLARAGGEFAIEIRDGAERRLVSVEPGLYAGGFVEIDGEGLRPGMVVTDARV